MSRWLVGVGVVCVSVVARADDVFYVATEGSNAVHQVQVSQGGGSQLLPDLSHPSLDRPFALATRARGDLFINSRGPCTACLGGGLTDLFSFACGTLSGTGRATAAGPRNPHGVCVVGDTAYMVDSYNGRVVRYTLSDSDPPLLSGAYALPTSPWGGRGIVAAPALGELLIADCCNAPGVHRYQLHADGSLTYRSSIFGNGMNQPHSMAISPWGELFVGSLRAGGVVSRFVFDSNGNAVPNGIISGNGMNTPGAPIFSSWGELVVFNFSSPVASRFLFDGSHNAIPNGTISIPSPAITVARKGEVPAMIAMAAQNDGCIGGAVSLTLVGASDLLTYQWMHDGVPVSPDDNPTAAAPTFTIPFLRSSDVGSYTCLVNTGCGQTQSTPVPVRICAGDYNCDGGVDGTDVQSFFADWERGLESADINADGGIDGADVSAFFEHWEAGC
ncbi:MAG: hypothetical protein JSR77_17025 [Planctomycetes bacterium]|nr:hypothetical protein [Planctomycetota bacterium]